MQILEREELAVIMQHNMLHMQSEVLLREQQRLKEEERMMFLNSIATLWISDVSDVASSHSW